MMLPPVGKSGGGGPPGGQQSRQRADSLEQFFAERRQSHPALEPRPPHERRGAGMSRGTRQCRREIMGRPAEAIMFRLPSLKESLSDAELHAQLLLQKMRQCQEPMDWEEPEAEKAEKEVKAEALRELNEWLGGEWAAGQLNGSRQMREELVEIVRANLFRVLPPTDSVHQEADSDELAGIGLGTKLASGACLEPGWAHLQLVYRLLQQIIQRIEPSKEGGMAELIDGQFVGQLLALFNSEDPREREQAKQTLHSLYSKMIPLRSEIRKRIGWLLLSHVYEEEPCRGIPEILEILGDIVNGFNVPLKSEHRHYFLRILLPLHKPQGYLGHFAPLAYCVALFLEKDPTLAKPTFDALLRHWPKHSSAKEILFMAELEELLSRIGQSEFRPICVPLFVQLAKCASSQHCRVAERALQLWNNENVLALLEPNCPQTLPIMFHALYTASQGHWNETISTMVFKTLKRLMCLNAVLFDELVLNWEKEQLKRRKRRNERDELWRKLSDALEEKKAKEGEEEAAEEEEGEGRMEEKENKSERNGRRRSGDGGGSRRGSGGGDGGGRGTTKRRGGGQKGSQNGHGQRAQEQQHHRQEHHSLVRQLTSMI